MNDAFVNNFFGWHTLVFMLGCYVLTFFTRRVLETAIPSLPMKADENDPAPSYPTVMSRWWNKVIVYVLPVAFGALLGLVAKKYPFPDGFQSVSARLLFGVFAGFFSGFVFKIVTQIIGKKFGVDLGGGSIPPKVGG
jgi:hypothetical protein